MADPEVPRKIRRFLRGVLPADPAHWLLLVGSTCLFISQHLRWWVASTTDLRLWAILVILMALPLVATGAVGCYVALLPTRNPVRRLSLFVLLPGLATILAIPLAGVFLYPEQMGLGLGIESIIYSSTHSIADRLAAIPHVVMNLGTGPQFAALGILLIAIFVALLRLGWTTVPIRLASSTESEVTEKNSVMLFVWMMMCLVPAVAFVSGLLFLPLFFVESLKSSLHWITEIVSALLLLALVLLALGKDRIPTLRSGVFRRTSMGLTGLAVLFPAVIASAPPLVHFVYDRGQWAAGNLGLFPPLLSTYFPMMRLAFVWLLIPALIEETAWRGYLQPRFVARYGIARGIFFVGIVWGAFHFSGDFHAHMSAGSIAYHLGRRLAGTVVQSYVLAWLTIKANSVIPAAFAHATYNAFVFSETRFPVPPLMIVLLWAVLGYVLFRYFPPRTDESETKNSESDLALGEQPAV